ncbi:hypothetical protein PSTEL_21435 [Paenibacillus stellifer]|uniref:ATP-grasp domain-containing protein n=1 Tax=Paenibacillus stellifer TaxID=169760 RepID=A0A089M1D2_9BACL|nr:YheC/YheD family protein [Paenibacillus stellifer]AIQ65303.1 hypothetical protein PSTEL_21435 [Paenibacillus stellifer]
MEHRLVGILLNAAAHDGIPRGRTGWESLDLYEKGAAAYGLKACFLKLSELDLASGRCLAYIRTARRLVKTTVPIPGVIHNRAIYPPGSTATERLSARGIRVFNLHTRYPKDEIHQLLMNEPGLVPHLPDTESGIEGLRNMLERHSDLILKPRRGSVGRGIMRLRRDNVGWIWEFLSKGQVEYVRLPSPEVPSALLLRIHEGSYLVQERLPLAEAENQPFDLRVTVQRGFGGEWAVTGLFAKLAPPGSFVSNIARGGEAAEAVSVLEKVFTPREAAHYRMGAADLALRVVRTLERSLPGLADVGLDIGVTRDGKLYFIECNGRDQRYGFFKAGLASAWKDSYRRPMAYARHLLDQDVRE